MPAKDEDGAPVTIEVTPKPGILMYSTPFEFKVRPRSEKHVALIRRIEQDDPVEEGDAQFLDSVDELGVE